MSISERTTPASIPVRGNLQIILTEDEVLRPVFRIIGHGDVVPLRLFASPVVYRRIRRHVGDQQVGQVDFTDGDRQLARDFGHRAF